MNSCCFCIPLKTGCFIIGYLSLVGVLCYILTLLPLMFCSSIDQVIKYIARINTKAGVDLLRIVYTAEDPRNILMTVKIVIGILIAVLFLHFMFNLFLVLGLHQNRPGPVRIYLIFTCTWLALLVIFCIGVLIAKFNLLFFLISTMQTLMELYFLFVIKSMYNKMGDSSGCVIQSANPASHIVSYSPPTTYSTTVLSANPAPKHPAPTALPPYSGNTCPSYSSSYPGHQLPNPNNQELQYKL